MTGPVDKNIPLRLKDAIEIAFPRGGITVAGLRREIARGRLTVELIANKQFVTLAAIEEMRERCRQPAAAPQPQQDGSPSREERLRARDNALARLDKALPGTRQARIRSDKAALDMTLEQIRVASSEEKAERQRARTAALSLKLSLDKLKKPKSLS